jgi:hypothetical protein
MLKLASIHTARLLSQAESGMGYQIVNVKYSNDTTERCIVYNAEILIPFYELEQISNKYTTYTRLLERAGSSANIIIGLTVTSKPIVEKFGRMKETVGADESPITYTSKNDIFKRFSAFKNDKRITPNGGLMPGTYATTYDDALNVSTGMDAVSRYALPSSKPASYVFTIKPFEYTVIQQGIVQPANEQPGGGVEIIFVKGTTNNTVSGPITIPDQ